MTNVFHWEMFPRPIYTFAVNPPLYNYQQALLIKLFGWNLTILHLLSAAYVLLAAAAMMALARRFATWPAPAMLLLMLAPAVVPGTNLMLDTPALALGLAAVAAWITGIDERSNRWLALSAALATAAVWTKYNSGLMLPPLPLYAALRQRWRAIPWALVPVAGLGLWALHNHLFMPNGTIHLLQSTHWAKEVERVAFLQVLLALVSWGSGFFFLPAFRIRAWARGRGAGLVVAAVLAALTLGADLLVTFGPTPLGGWRITRSTSCFSRTASCSPRASQSRPAGPGRREPGATPRLVTTCSCSRGRWG
jgi:4-amino-4-deoxy-L-arabinose transferase-like glycosyltransferase